MKPQAIWASVIIVFILISSATTLVILGKDVTIILTLVVLVALPVLGGFGAAFGSAIMQKMNKLEENTNGNLHRVLDLHQQSTKQLTDLAMSMTPTSAPPATEGDQTGEA